MPNFRIFCYFFISRKRSILYGFYNIFEWDRPNKDCVWILWLIWETLEFSKKNFIGKKFSNFFDPKNIFSDDVYKSKTLYLGVIVCFKRLEQLESIFEFISGRKFKIFIEINDFLSKSQNLIWDCQWRSRGQISRRNSQNMVF